MNVADLLLVSLYNHFCNLQNRRKQIVPWFQTCVVIALYGTFSCFIIFRLIFFYGTPQVKTSEPIFLFIFLGIAFLLFFAVKRYFFDSGKHIKLSEKFIKDYSEEQQKRYKTISLLALTIAPFLLIFLLWATS